jgi:phosphate uptake regulator
METRKLIKFGESSFVISVPQAWIIKHKLSKGDSVYLEEIEKGLLVNPYKDDIKKEKKTVIITAGKGENTIEREIISAYLNNSNIIEFSGKDLVLKAKSITGFIRKLMSFEIIEQTSNKIVVKDFLNLKDISIQDIVKRMDIITRAMMEDAVLCVKQDLCENIDYRDLDVNRFYYLIFRVIKGGMKNPNIAKILKMTQGELLDYYRLIQAIEDIADCVKRIARALRILDISQKRRKDLLDLFAESKELYLASIKSYYNRDKQLADQYSQAGKDIMEKCNKFLETTQVSEVPGIIEKLKVITKNTRNIARITIDLE